MLDKCGDGASGNTLEQNPYVDYNEGGSKTLEYMHLGFAHSCVIFTDTTSKCWGSGGYGLKGDASTAAKSATTASYHDFGNSRYAVFISGVRYTTCAILDDGQTR